MKKKVVVFISVVAMLVGTLAGCGEEKKEEPKEKVYLEESEIENLFSNPEKYAGKYVKLSGQIFNGPEKDGEMTAMQIWHDIANTEKNFIVHTKNGEDLKSQDYVFVEGKIEGSFSGENAFGGDVECPLIVDAKVTKGSYLDVVTPTISEITPAVSQEQNGVSVTIDKVEYAEEETRVYVTIQNDTEYNYSCGTYSAKLLVNGKQLDQNSMSQTIYNSPELEELSYEVMAGTSSSGVLIFPAIVQNVPFQFILPDSVSDNYDLEFSNYMIDVPAE